MDKEEIIDFFNSLAPNWDAEMIRDDAVISAILDYAGISEGVSVLDVACGTGVLFEDYLERKVKRLTGVDIAPAMIEIARAKFNDKRITLLSEDIEDADFPEPFDRCVVYNAFPHFPNPSRLIERLAAFIDLGGRLTIAHGMSRNEIDKRHSGSARKVSIGLMDETELARLLQPFFKVDTVISDDRMYVVSGIKIK